jgi:hypothetical protein
LNAEFGWECGFVVPMVLKILARELRKIATPNMIQFILGTSMINFM